MASFSVEHIPIPPPSSRSRFSSIASTSHVFLPSLSFSSARNRTSLLTVSARMDYKQSSMSEENKKLLQEKYGLNPKDYTSEPTQKPKRRGAEKEERGDVPEVNVTPAVKATPRSTHKLLKVLGGKVRRKKLLSPKGMDVRPMMEVVKGAAFDILQVSGGCPALLKPGRWLDLYCGTGSVGIEALSRGCIEAHFVELDSWVVSDVLRPNLQWTGFLDVSVIHTLRVEDFLERSEKLCGNGGPFDYVSVTPPYSAVNYTTLMEQLAKCPLIGKDCFILVEYPLKLSMEESCGHLVKIADRRFGRTNLLIYGPIWAVKKRMADSLLLEPSAINS